MRTSFLQVNSKFCGIAFFVLERYFIDTLCIISLFAILFELAPENVLSDPYRKRFVLKYINDLARNTLLLPSSFVGSLAINSAMKDHFRNMEKFIRERETLIVLAKDDTLDVLRKDFYNLTSIYLAERYGQFEWNIETKENEIPDPKKTLLQSVLFLVTRLLGIVIPVAVWIFAVNNPDIILKLGIDSNFLTLILLAWFLVLLDTTFKLGIVSTVIAVFKEFRATK